MSIYYANDSICLFKISALKGGPFFNVKLNKTKKWLKNALLLWYPHNLTKKVTRKGEKWMKDNYIYTRLTTSVWHRKLIKNSQKLFYWYQKTINGNFLSHEHAYLKTPLHTMKVYNTDQLASPSKFCSWSLSFFLPLITCSKVINAFKR